MLFLISSVVGDVDSSAFDVAIVNGVASVVDFAVKRSFQERNLLASSEFSKLI